MYNILLIDANSTVQNCMLNAAPKISCDITAVTDTFYDEIHARISLKLLCNKYRFNFALLNAKLWNYVDGTKIVIALKDSRVPIVAFSENEELNSKLIALGAVASINQNQIFKSRGFDIVKLSKEIDKLRGVIKK